MPNKPYLANYKSAYSAVHECPYCNSYHTEERANYQQIETSIVTDTTHLIQNISMWCLDCNRGYSRSLTSRLSEYRVR